MEEKTGMKAHKVLLSNRKNGNFSGVVDVLSFDVAEILLETEQGMLLIKGNNLHVNRLSLEKGEVDIEGRIDSLAYSEVLLWAAVQMTGSVSETIAGEGSLLLASFLFGIVLMLLYDIFRIFRHIVKHGAVLMAVEDAFYWILCAIGIFAMLYQENDGLLRWFVLGGVAIGMLLENALISPWVIRIFVKVIETWLGVFQRAFGIFAKPGKKACSFGKKELKKIRKAIKIGLSKH